MILLPTAYCSEYIVLTEPGLLIGRDILLIQNPTCWLVVIYCLYRTQPADWSSKLLWQNPACWLVVIYCSYRTGPANWSWYKVLTELGLQIGRKYFWKNTTCWLVVIYCFYRTRLVDWTWYIVLTEPGHWLAQAFNIRALIKVLYSEIHDFIILYYIFIWLC